MTFYFMWYTSVRDIKNISYSNIPRIGDLEIYTVLPYNKTFFHNTQQICYDLAKHLALHVSINVIFRTQSLYITFKIHCDDSLAHLSLYDLGDKLFNFFKIKWLRTGVADRQDSSLTEEKFILFIDKHPPTLNYKINYHTINIQLINNCSLHNIHKAFHFSAGNHIYISTEFENDNTINVKSHVLGMSILKEQGFKINNLKNRFDWLNIILKHDDVLSCQEALIENGFTEYAKL